MNSAEAQLRRLIKAAPKSEQHLVELLRDGLGWPVGVDFNWQDERWDWKPAELGLDPDKVAALTSISQVPPLTAGQDFGVFVLQFAGGRLPIGAVRRLVGQLVDERRRRSKKAGTAPTWALNDLLFFCLSDTDAPALHVVGMRDTDEGRRSLRVITWDPRMTETSLELAVLRDAPMLRWGPEDKPAIAGDLTVITTFGEYRGAIKSAASLANRMAEVAQTVRAEVLELYDVELEGGTIRSLFDELRGELLADLTPERFADILAQTMVYGLLSARITAPEAFAAASNQLDVDFENPLLDSIYARLHDSSAVDLDIDELGLGDLALELAKADVERILADFGTANRRDDPVVFFYEEFLAKYDPRQRLSSGAFYTPTPVVEFMVGAVDHVLKTSFELPLGVADESTWSEAAEANGFSVPAGVDPNERFVSMIDPATGTGTFLVEWIRRAKRSFVAARSSTGWPDHLRTVVMPSMHAFEITLAAYAVAHLKIALEAHASADVDPDISLLLTDSLDYPMDQLVLDTLDDPVAAEGERATSLKREKRFTVCIGNPPYDREQASDADGGRRKGGVVRYGTQEIRPLMEDITDRMKAAGLGRHSKNLYNDYVYFWRWATWVTTQKPAGPGVTAFITAASFLDGVSMAGCEAISGIDSTS